MFLKRLFGQNKVKGHTSVQSPGLEGSTQVTPHGEGPQKPRMADCLAGDKTPWETTEAPVGSGAMLQNTFLKAPGKTELGVNQGGGETLQEPGLEQNQDVPDTAPLVPLDTLRDSDPAEFCWS